MTKKAQPSSRWLYAVTGLLSGAVVAVAAIAAMQPPPKVVVERVSPPAPTLEARTLDPAPKPEGDTIEVARKPAPEPAPRPAPAPAAAPEPPPKKPKTKPRPKPRLPKSLTTDQIKTALAPAKARAKTCGSAHMSLPGEKITVRLKISGKTGRVTSATPTTPSALGSCVAAKMKTAKTPRFAKPSQTVVYSVRM